MGVLPMEFVDEAACLFNRAVQCPSHDKCDKCGWNPEVAAKRAAAIRADLAADFEMEEE